MAKLTLNNIASGFASNTALNANFDAIETALENTLSRDGTSPNQMIVDLDMNSNAILNASGLILNGVSVVPTGTTTVNANGMTYLPVGTGVATTTVQEKLREVLSAKLDFGAVGDGIADDTIALQSAITTAITSKKDLYIPAGTYKITSTLNITNTSIRIYGAGRYETTFDSFAAGSAILCSTFYGKLGDFTVYVNNATGNGIEIGTASLNCAIHDVYAQVSSTYMATTTGSGLYLNAGTGWSGGLNVSNSYFLVFKYGIRMAGTHLANNTWSAVTMYNVWLVGNSAGILAGSAGIYMDAFTNGIGTIMMGGTIESFATGIQILSGGNGGVFETDMEGNTLNYSVGNTFTGRIIPSQGTPVRERAANIIGTESAMQFAQNAGAAPSHESYYPPSWLTKGLGASTAPINWYSNDTSIIEGGALEANALKISFGMGQGGTYGIDVHPSQHYLGIGNRKVSFGAESPAVRVGSQLVAWTVGSVCFNSSSPSAYGTGWICAASGTPGTWRPFGQQLYHYTYGDNDLNIESPGYPSTIIFNTTLTADRAVITANNASTGYRIRISRPAGGAFNLNVGTGPLKALAAGTWCDIEFNGTAWVLVGYGSL